MLEDCKYACLTHSINAPSVSGAVVPFVVMARFALFGQRVGVSQVRATAMEHLAKGRGIGWHKYIVGPFMQRGQIKKTAEAFVAC